MKLARSPSVAKAEIAGSTGVAAVSAVVAGDWLSLGINESSDQSIEAEKLTERRKIVG